MDYALTDLFIIYYYLHIYIYVVYLIYVREILSSIKRSGVVSCHNRQVIRETDVVRKRRAIVPRDG